MNAEIKELLNEEFTAREIMEIGDELDLLNDNNIYVNDIDDVFANDYPSDLYNVFTGSDYDPDHDYVYYYNTYDLYSGNASAFSDEVSEYISEYLDDEVITKDDFGDLDGDLAERLEELHMKYFEGKRKEHDREILKEFYKEVVELMANLERELEVM